MSDHFIRHADDQEGVCPGGCVHRHPITGADGRPSLGVATGQRSFDDARFGLGRRPSPIGEGRCPAVDGRDEGGAPTVVIGRALGVFDVAPDDAGPDHVDDIRICIEAGFDGFRIQAGLHRELPRHHDEVERSHQVGCESGAAVEGRAVAGDGEDDEGRGDGDRRCRQNRRVRAVAWTSSRRAVASRSCRDAAHRIVACGDGRGVDDVVPGQFAGDATVGEHDDAFGATGDVGFVRDQDDGAPVLRMQIGEEFADQGRCHRIEIAGRFVGEDEGRIVDQGAGDGDPLLFTAGEGIRPVSGAIGEADALQSRLGALVGFACGDAVE